MENIIFAIIIVAILTGAIFYIIKHRKEGAKCMGCPQAKKCSKCKEGGCKSEKRLDS